MMLVARHGPTCAALALLLAACASAADGQLNQCIPVAREDLRQPEEEIGGFTLVCSAYFIGPGALDAYRERHPEAFAGVELPWTAR